MTEDLSRDQIAPAEIPSVNVTPRAVRELKGLQAGDRQASVLRLSVAGKTCCGYRYGLAFEAEPKDGDTITAYDGLRLVIDEQSRAQCDGVMLDFVETPKGAGFSVQGRVTPGGCSCGRR
jgi:iron-sulfur cluster assembly protein